MTLIPQSRRSIRDANSAARLALPVRQAGVDLGALYSGDTGRPRSVGSAVLLRLEIFICIVFWHLREF